MSQSSASFLRGASPIAVSEANPMPVESQNITAKFRETFGTWPSAEWVETKAAGDIVTVDGNAMGASYLTISMDPLSADTETYVDTVQSFSMPIELAVGLHASQQAWGQDLSVELIDRQFIAETPADLAISSITQTTTVLTVDTVLPHNLAVGKRIGIRGCSNAIVNYPSLVIATVTSPTQFTVTGGPNSTIPSQTVTNPTGNKGFVYFRPALSSSRNGTSMHLENATVTQGFFYARASAGDSLPFASGSGNALTARQATTTGTTASVALAAAPYTYAFVPTNEYRLTLMADRLQWSDALVDSLTAATNRVLRTQVVPNPAKDYFLRIKARSEPSLTVPVGQIVTVSKAGSTNATVTMDRPHGLVTGDLVVGYGSRETASTFYPALTTAAAVTVLTDTTFTVSWGTSGTTTSYGGFISKVNAACPQPGAVTMAVQSAVKTTLADGQHQVVLVGSATWAGVVIGDYVNLVGVRDTVTGATIGIDGAWRVANLSTTNLTLVNIPGYSPVVADFALINCGGGVIKRTDLRISYVRLFDFERLRVEMLPRPTGDIAGAAPVSVQNVPAVTMTSTTIAGTVAVDAAIGSPVTAGLRASNANIAAMSAAGDNVALLGTMIGVQVVRPYSLPEADWVTPAPVGGIVNTTTSFQVRESAGAGIRNYVTSIDLVSEALTNATDFRIREPDLTAASQTIASNTLTTGTHGLAIGDAVVATASGVTGLTVGVTYFVLTVPAATTMTLSATRGGSTLAISGTSVTATLHKVLWQTRIPTTGMVPLQIVFPTPLRGSIATAVLLQTATASGAGAVYANVQGHSAP